MSKTCKTCGQDKEFCNKSSAKKHGICEFYIDIEKTPKCCNECSRYCKDPDEPGTGYCDEWPVKLQNDWLCHPIIGRKGKPHMLKPMKREKKDEQ